MFSFGPLAAVFFVVESVEKPDFTGLGDQHSGPVKDVRFWSPLERHELAYCRRNVLAAIVQIWHERGLPIFRLNSAFSSTAAAAVAADVGVLLTARFAIAVALVVVFELRAVLR